MQHSKDKVSPPARGRFQLLLTLWAAFSLAPLLAQEPKPTLSPGTNNTLVVPRSALGQEFLLSASIRPQALAPTSYGQAGHVVRFELFPDGLDLYEATEGFVVTKELPARRLITTFKIVAQDEKQLVIDFNQGMRRVFIESWGDDGFNHDRTLEVPESRVFSVEKTGDYLVIRQAVQARNREADANRETRYEVRYFLSPYASAAKGGKEQAAADTRYARFFETAPIIEDVTGRESSKMARFDLAQPVSVYYSANTPAEYVEAVRDGILYWNRAFGKEVVKAEKAPDGVTAPDASRNIVQWVPWDNAGFAYADLLLDPRTGQSLHGQVYLTSAFVVSSRAGARRMLRTMTELAEPAKDGKKAQQAAVLGLSFLQHSPACRIEPGDFAAEYAKGLQELLADEKLTDAAVLRAAQDLLREVTAHEVGHVLGLRHNFAGSLEATVTPKELDEFFKAYVAGTNLDTFTNKISTSSVMDYNVFKSRVYVGWKMRTSKDALPYDKASIQWGYFDSREPIEKKVLFGTDGDVGRYGDVQRFDYGAEAVVGAYGELAAGLRNLPNTLIERFIEARAPRDPRDRIPLEQVNLYVKGYAGQTVNHLQSMLHWYQAGMRSLRLENSFDFIGDLNEKERAKAHWKSLVEQFDKLGGVDRALFAVLPADLKLELKDDPKDAPIAEKISAAALTTRVEKLLDAPVYANFVGLDEKKYSFTKEEKALINRRAKDFFTEFEKEVLKQFCARLENAPRDLGNLANGGVTEDDVVAKLEKRIIDLAHALILTKNDSERLEGSVFSTITLVKTFKYDDETRMAAAKMLNDKTGSYREWAMDAKGDINKALKDDVESQLNISHFKEFKDSDLTRSLRDWYLKQQDLLAILPPRPK